MNKIEKVVKTDLCLGCGLCEAIATKEKCSMILEENGFYRPRFTQPVSQKTIKSIAKCCPGISVRNHRENNDIWGKVAEIKDAWSSDPTIRKKGSSGGILTALAVFLLENKLVDGILQVGKSATHYLHNELKISRTREEVIENASSRYAPALVFDQIKLILDQNNEKYAFIGKPCDIAGIKNFVREFSQYENRIIYHLAIFCAGMPSYNGTKKIIENSGIQDKPINLKYRGDGWPGFFEVKFEKSPSFKVSYNDSWGNVLGKHLGMRCKICPDGIGLLADIVAGDSWNTKDGYPDFTESDGRSFVLIRNTKGTELFQKALAEKAIISESLEESKIKEIQNYQYLRRLLAGYRILPVQIFTGGLLSFKQLSLFKLALKANYITGLNNLLGTMKRLIKDL
ncbi:Coenzyme F420 hydrogenase/dehydrogenase, beta subunit C-terminal domain [Mangrovibacterium diazotrophicum]|uniref:Coenzyme F420 hydrogenase subunit beta n=1 Tax=Mangrovibacterium diazotrophicum TaxID=1261403 RepID=A0A419W5S4_9BACT|nr:Coenzyme F420 hydrogenase/dehydrogenase, beta subunit C-terminal domain [Mangrovibacterium diazotrophicum]RKD90770.1 coenzyme F420 hydrogenase subunit beta [Mangrovibacterium diazotrophicum]